MPKENLFIAENQDLDVDEQKKNDILSFIESCNNFQDFIKKLEKENLIWYFIGPLRKDENIKEQINLKWKKEFQKFEQSINETHKNFETSLPGENFLYQFLLLMNQIRSIAELFNCGRGKRGNKFTQSALKQNNCIVDLIA